MLVSDCDWLGESLAVCEALCVQEELTEGVVVQLELEVGVSEVVAVGVILPLGVWVWQATRTMIAQKAIKRNRWL